MNQMHPVHTFPSRYLLLSSFPTNILCAFLILPLRATWPSQLILFDFITLIKFGEGYKSLGLSFFMQSSPTSPLDIAVNRNFKF